MMRENYPLISCICVTYDRPDLLYRAIVCFESQNYPNKELVISYPEKDEQTRTLLDNFMEHSQMNIMRIIRSDGESVGNARNSAIAKCHGDYMCVWDDDDWYHSSRLSYQYNSMKTTASGYNASVLRSLIFFDETTKNAYQSFRYPWENTLLCRKEIILQNPYAHTNKGEDTHIIKFLDGKKFLHYIDDAPYLYVYIYHGRNTWDHDHYSHLIQKSKLLEDDIAEAIAKTIY